MHIKKHGERSNVRGVNNPRGTNVKEDKHGPVHIHYKNIDEDEDAEKYKDGNGRRKKK